MIVVSSQFDADISQNTTPKIYAEVEFRQLAVGAAGNAGYTATGADSVSRLDQLSNFVTALTNYGTFETGRDFLDGSQWLLPADSTLPGQVGAWSSAISGANKAFSTSLVLTVTLSSAITSAGLSIHFDTAQGTYPSSFTVKVYNGSTLLKTISATATGSLWVYDTAISSSYNKLVITIAAWSAAGQRARIAQIMFGVIRIFDNESLVEFSVLRQIDPVNASNPSSELSFAIDNRDGKYDFENPAGIFNYITSKQEVYARIGFEAELVPLGTFYMTTPWESDQEEGKAAFKALDALSLLEVSFTDATYTSQTLATIAAAALSQAGITNYSLDSSLSGITVTATIEGKTCRQVLVNIAVAACLTLYVDIDGKSTIGSLPAVSSDYMISYANSKKPKGTMDEPLKSITVSYGTDLEVTASYESRGQEISISDNPFITDSTRAAAVLAWLAAYYQRRKNYQNDWRQNPKIETGDIINITTEYGTPEAQVLSQQFTYSGGGFSGQTKSKGV